MIDKENKTCEETIVDENMEEAKRLYKKVIQKQKSSLFTRLISDFLQFVSPQYSLR